MSQPRRTPNVWDAPPRVPLVDPSSFMGKKPNKTIPVPSEYRRQTLARERDTLIYDIFVEANCSVVPHWDQGSGKIKSFDIYGAGSNLEKAVTHVNRWISNAHVKTKESSAWAKLPAYDANRWHYDRVEEKEKESKQRFKGPVPPPDDPDAPRHKVNWPAILSDEQSGEKLSPRDVWGNKLEHLDQLRMQDNVWITLQSGAGQKWRIEIAGHEIADVAAAREHFDTLLSQVHADASGVQHAHNIILDEREGILVQLQEDEEWWPNHTDKIVPRLLPDEMMDEPGEFRYQKLHPTQLSSIHTAIQLSFERIRSKKGAYDLSVRLGCIALKASRHVSNDKIGQNFTKKAFLNDVNGSTELNVKKWLANDEYGYRILHRLMSQTAFLEPTKSAGYFGCMPDTLDKTRPTFRGTWVFRDPSSAVSRPQAPPRHPGRPVPLNQIPINRESVPPTPTTIFVIQVDWTDDEDGQYEKSTPKFYKLGAGKGGPIKNMDVNLLELGESRGWHFALESLIPVPPTTVPPILTGFAEQVKMKKGYDVCSTESFAEWESTPSVKAHLQTGRLDSVYRFGIKDTCYKVELAAMWYPRQKLPVWGLAVRHLEWETHLADLESLHIGSRADWGDTMSTFFPKDGQSSQTDNSEDFDVGQLKFDNFDANPAQDGLGVLVEKLMKLSDIVSSVTNEGGVRL